MKTTKKQTRERERERDHIDLKDILKQIDLEDVKELITKRMPIEAGVSKMQTPNIG